MDINDPRNVLVDPGSVLDVFTNDVYGQTVTEISCACCSS